MSLSFDSFTSIWKKPIKIFHIKNLIKISTKSFERYHIRTFGYEPANATCMDKNIKTLFCQKGEWEIQNVTTAFGIL